MSEEFFVSPDEQRAYDSIVRPHAIIPVPMYYLDQWVPLLGTSRAWLALAFRQVAFVSRCNTVETSLSTTLRKLGRWSGLTHVRVHQLLQDPFHLTWFVRPSEGDFLEHPGPRSQARNYLVRVDVPLIPKDQLRLRAWFKAQSPVDDQEWLSVIEDGLSAKDLDIPPKTKLPQEPRTIQQIVNELRESKTPLPPSLDQACTELHARWVQPDRVSLVTHYFIHHWLPQLSSGLGWLVVLLRSRAYHDEPEAQVGQVWSAGGWSQLADILGTSRRSVSRWRSLKEAKLFYSQVKNAKDPKNRRSLLLSVRLSEPIHSDHQEAYEMLLQGQELTSNLSLPGQDLTIPVSESGQHLTKDSYPHSFPQTTGQDLTSMRHHLPTTGQELPAGVKNEQDSDKTERVKSFKDSLNISSKDFNDSNNSTVQDNREREHLERIAEQLWGRAREQLQMELPRNAYETWVKDVEAETVEQDQTLVLAVVNSFAKDWLEDRLASTAQRVLSGIAGKPMQVRFITQEEGQKEENG